MSENHSRIYVQVLMSTYNGEKYLKEQLDSILFQQVPDRVEISILVRDDGSSDGTRELLSRYVQTYPQVSFFQGKNLGAIDSFFHLVKNADLSADYYAFADQDDIWHPNKLKRAIGTLLREKKNLRQQGENQTIPLLYCCKPRLVDQDGEPLKVRMKQGDKYPGFGNALVENIVYGCTMVANSSLLEMVREHIPDYTIMHDWWFYLTATAFGRVLYDSHACIDYRQHGNNEMGSRSNYVDEFKERVTRYRRNRRNISMQCEEFIRLYGEELPEEKLQLAKLLLDGTKSKAARIQLIRETEIFRQRKGDDLIFRMIYLTGSY